MAVVVGAGGGRAGLDGVNRWDAWLAALGPPDQTDPYSALEPVRSQAKVQSR
jgi:hypothetical protein